MDTKEAFDANKSKYKTVNAVPQFYVSILPCSNSCIPPLNKRLLAFATELFNFCITLVILNIQYAQKHQERYMCLKEI